ncbi:MAG: bifunctional adenosylcobinamide kinase/adenosylcobinamide-phosphate guanylyltransferase [Nocardioides sp.]|uniref:bifunctional adenosylcobinamide kinase/adenosylcobinamide-phosphate guanylyltransferase n=1 Tax=Nocardioides sp. TaxID=35761 RepID=UPI0039E64DE7
MTTLLVTGGVRSGKSRHAESLLATTPEVTYVAAGPAPEAEADPDWTARVAAHRARRPVSWGCVESTDLAGALAEARGSVLIDCLGSWLPGLLDQHELWEAPVAEVTELVERQVAETVAALGAHQAGIPGADVVIVTNEVGMGIVPAYRSGRLFRDLLGTVNQQVAAACDEVHLVVAGRVLVL